MRGSPGALCLSWQKSAPALLDSRTKYGWVALWPTYLRTRGDVTGSIAGKLVYTLAPAKQE